MRLIFIELNKIFHKKSPYIILLLMFLFCLLNNYLYKRDYNEEGFYKYKNQDNIKEQLEALSETLNKLDKNSNQYIETKTNIEILSLKETFSPNSWQYSIIDNALYDITYQKNTYTTPKKEIIEQYEKEVKELKNDNWVYFIKKEIDNCTQEKEELLATLNNTSREEQTIINKRIEELNHKIDLAKYRIKEKIKPGTNYLNIALEKVESSQKVINTLSNKKLTKKEKEILEEEVATKKENEYILNTKQNINQENSLNYQLRTLTEDYELFLIILILIIASNTICEEFNKGTIKLLLIKPYSRGKILISKYLACLITLMISILFLIGIELLIGIPFLKTDSLKWPVIIYHYGKKKIIKYSIKKYMWIRIIARLPFFIIILTINFTLSVLLNSTALSISLPMLLYLLDGMINHIETTPYIKFTKYLINHHWHLENYLFGKNTNNLKLSIIVWLIYFLVLSTITLHHFKRKDIKNI